MRQVIERWSVRDVVYQNGRVAISVKGNSERLESFLTGRIPQLEHHRDLCAVFSRHQYFTTDTIGANRRLELAREFSSGVAIHEGCLADARNNSVRERLDDWRFHLPGISQNDNFEGFLGHGRYE